MGSEFVARKSSVWGKKSDAKPSLFASRPFSVQTRQDNTVNKKELPSEIPPANYITDKMGFNSSQPTVQRQEDNSDKEQEPDLMSKSDESPVADEEEKISPQLEDENQEENVNLKPAVEEGDEETISPQLEDENKKEDLQLTADEPEKEDSQLDLKSDGAIQAKCSNCESEAQQKSESIQTKLTVGEPGDKYEQEADTVATKVVEQINSPKSQQPVQGKVEPVVQPTLMRQGGASGGTVNRDVEQNIQQARGGGQGLADNVRQPMEQAFGADFSGVKVHTGGQADVLNRSLNSRAFATGQDIFFKQGEYNPGSRGGQELLAHELTHVVQQDSNLNGIQRDIQSPQFSDNRHLKDLYNNKSYIRKGNSGLQVRMIQQALLDAGHSLPEYGVDGKFGSETEAAVKAFQEAQGLKDDGIVGPKTMKALDTFFLNHGAMTIDMPPTTIRAGKPRNLDRLKGMTNQGLSDAQQENMDMEHGNEDLIRQSSVDPSEPLPFKGSSWNGNQIAERLGQYDQISGTDSDAVRCVQTVALISHILMSPQAVNSYLLSISSQGMLSRKMTDRRQTALEVIDYVRYRITSKQATYGDLCWVIEAVHGLFYPDDEGTPIDQIREQITPITDFSQEMQPMDVWCNTFEDLLTQAKKLQKGEQLMLTNWTVSFNLNFEKLQQEGKKMTMRRLITKPKPSHTKIDLNRDHQEGHQLLIFKDTSSGAIKLYEPEEKGKQHLFDFSQNLSTLEKMLFHDQPKFELFKYLQVNGKITPNTQ